MDNFLQKNLDRASFAIVLSSNFSPAILQQFCFLSRYFEVTVFLLADGYSNHPIPGAFNLELFYQDQNLPGYMRGLEKRLADYQFILGIGSLNVATHQAFRFAQNQEIAFILYETILSSHEKGVREFFLGCSLVIVPKELLGYENISEQTNKFLAFSPALNYEARFRQEAREKFRSYFKFSSDDKVICVVGNTFSQDDMLLQYLISKAKESLEIKFLIHCDKSQSEAIKYLMVASAVANRFFFIHQSIEPFAFDLFAASDVVFLTKEWQKQNEERHFFYSKDMEGLGFTLATLSIANSLIEAASSALGFSMLCELEAKASDTLLATEEALYKKLHLIEDKMATFDENDLNLDQQIERCKSKKRRSQLFCQKASYLMQCGQSDEAIEALEKSVQNEPSVGAYLELGFLALKTQAYDEAVVFFRKVLTLEAKNHRAFWGLGLVYRKVGLVGEAIYYLDLCIRLGMDQDFVITALVQTLIEVKDYNLVIKVLEDLVEIIGENKTLMRALGSTLIKSGETSKGYSILDKFII